ncbi:hypothetical protein BDD14_5753 [Edaphobacter modestus]|uniref:Uncharacterized protein n=1 Tax=Edaphobacter modestus TaxID=388466 RepID=A0A4Q7YGZ6_9BACT|nr:hypothetical protein BDD14_5753 [Edaphobacter modestus]
MCRYISKPDKVQTRNSNGERSVSDRTIVLDLLASCSQMGLGVLEEIPNLGSQFFSLRSGEVFWLGEDKITRIK